MGKMAIDRVNLLLAFASRESPTPDDLSNPGFAYLWGKKKEEARFKASKMEEGALNTQKKTYYPNQVQRTYSSEEEEEARKAKRAALEEKAQWEAHKKKMSESQRLSYYSMQPAPLPMPLYGYIPLMPPYSYYRFDAF
jgi:hypothetical protein